MVKNIFGEVSRIHFEIDIFRPSQRRRRAALIRLGSSELQGPDAFAFAWRLFVFRRALRQLDGERAEIRLVPSLTGSSE